MELLRYKYKDENNDGWDFSEVTFRNVNLFVGSTGSGKSRFLNSIYNLANFVYLNDLFRAGTWQVIFKIDDKTYKWNIETTSDKTAIKEERLSVLNTNNELEEIYIRDEEYFIYKGVKLPKLDKKSTGIHLLKEEDLIAPIHQGFSRILRRSFFGSDLEKACMPGTITQDNLEKAKSKIILDEKISWDFPLSIRLFLLKNVSNIKFNQIIEQFTSIFPSIENVSFVEGSTLIENYSNEKTSTPVLAIKEKNVRYQVMLHELSSGMQKVLLILSDVILMKSESVYMIDEYENSLGINAINFLPGFLLEYGQESQFLITSHHPYLINQIPVVDWHVFQRNGSEVIVRSGEELETRYGISNQDAFIKLINDPIYLGTN